MGGHHSVIQHIKKQIPPTPGQPNCNAGTAAVPGVQYIQLGFGSDYINLSQLVGIDKNGNNVTRGRHASGPVGWGGEPRNAVDGGEQPRGHPNEYHSSGQGQVFEVRLDGPTEMSRVTVYNRTDCCTGRMEGHVVKFLDGNRNVVWTSPQLRDLPSQTFSVCDAQFTLPPGYLKEQKRIELNMAKADVVKKQGEYDNLTPAEALKRKTDEGNLEANRYITSVQTRFNYEMDIYNTKFAKAEVLAKSPSFLLAQKYKNDLAAKYKTAEKANKRFKEAYVTNRRRFLDANPHESVAGIGPFKTLDDRILIMFWFCYLLFLIPIAYHIISGLSPKGSSGETMGKVGGIVFAACIIAHLAIRNLG
jgi:hypothetical protein